jgi:hypothetical protein
MVVPQFEIRRNLQSAALTKSSSEIAFFLRALAGMKTYYKPTQRRGKRVIYASTDPTERKKQTVIGWVALSIFVLGLGTIVWLIR